MGNLILQTVSADAAELHRGTRQVVADGALIRLVVGCGPAAEEPKASAAISESELVLRAEALAEARRMTDGIAGVLALLRNFDRLAPGEPEHVRIDEIAALFGDIGDFAAYGARTLRQAADAIRPPAIPKQA